MISQRPNEYTGWLKVIEGGALIGAALTIGYAQLFAIYATVRSSLEVLAMTPPQSDPEVNFIGTLVTNAATITLASTASALLVMLLTALLGALTAAAARALLAWFNREHSPARAAILGLIAALGVILLFQTSVALLMQRPLAALGLATYLFWLGLPSLLHLFAGVAGAWYLNRPSATFPFNYPEGYHVNS